VLVSSQSEVDDRRHRDGGFIFGAGKFFAVSLLQNADWTSTFGAVHQHRSPPLSTLGFPLDFLLPLAKFFLAFFYLPHQTIGFYFILFSRKKHNGKELFLKGINKSHATLFSVC